MPTPPLNNSELIASFPDNTQGLIHASNLRDLVNSVLLITNNLSDLTNAATARTNLGVYSTGQVDSLLAGSTPTTITGSIAESQVTNLTTDLASKLPLSGGTLTGTLIAPTVSAASGTTLTLGSQIISSSIPCVQAASATFTNSSGVSSALKIAPTFSTTASGGWTALQVAATQTSDTGGGAKNLILATVGGTTKFSVSSTGAATFGGGISATGSLNISGAVSASGWSGTLTINGGGATLNGNLTLGTGHSIVDGTYGTIYSGGTFYGSLVANGITMNGSQLNMGNGLTNGTGGSLNMEGGGLYLQGGTLTMYDGSGYGGSSVYFDAAALYLDYNSSITTDGSGDVTLSGATFTIGAPLTINADVTLPNNNLNLTSGNVSCNNLLTGTVSAQQIKNPNLDGTLVINPNNFTNSADGIDMATGTYTLSSATSHAVQILPTYTTSSTAGWVAFNVNVTRTNDVGTGTKYLASFGVGGSSKLNVDPSGNVVAAGAVAVGSINTATTSGTLAGQIVYDSSGGANNGHFMGWNGTAWKQLDN